MKASEILYLIFWLFLGLLINNYIIDDGPKVKVKIGNEIHPTIQVISENNEISTSDSNSPVFTCILKGRDYDEA